MTEPVPAPRIGDAERDQATEYLREHLAQGRLDQVEFDERMTAALSARTQPDIDRLFTDLPAPRPGQEVAVPQPAKSPVANPDGLPMSPKLVNAMGVLTAVIWPVTLLLLFAIGWGQYWWLIFVPIAISSLWGHYQQQNDQHRKRLRKEERRRLERGSDDSDES